MLARAVLGAHPEKMLDAAGGRNQALCMKNLQWVPDVDWPKGEIWDLKEPSQPEREFGYVVAHSNSRTFGAHIIVDPRELSVALRRDYTSMQDAARALLAAVAAQEGSGQ